MIIAARAIVFGSGLLAFAFWVRQWLAARKGRTETRRVVNSASRVGILVELLAAGVLFLWPQPHPPGLSEWVYVFGSALAVGSALLGVLAGRHLGEHMRVQAVVTAEHRLIMTGPYFLVRHPIYTCLLGLFFAAGMVFPHPQALLLAGPIFLAGTEIRMRAEDKLLAARFGREFDVYRQCVKSCVPGIR